MSNRIRPLIAKSLIAGLMAALWLSISVTAFGQSDNTQISGFVKDQAGAVVAGAKVVAKNETNGLERTATSNGEGYYIITQLPSGRYTVSIEANGFKQYKENGKKIDPNVPATLDVALQPGQVTEIVNITATAVGVQTESAALTKLVDEQTIKNTMINGRNPLFLAVTKPGVLGSNLGGNSFGLSQAGLVINGARTQDTLITFDGAVGVRTRSNGTSIGTADLDSTQEVQILTANYNAEYGRSAGGQVRIVTKGGGHDFHGLAYEYLRNAALNTNSWANNRLYNAARPCSDEASRKIKPAARILSGTINPVSTLTARSGFPALPLTKTVTSYSSSIAWSGSEFVQRATTFSAFPRPECAQAISANCSPAVRTTSRRLA